MGNDEQKATLSKQKRRLREEVERTEDEIARLKLFLESELEPARGGEDGDVVRRTVGGGDAAYVTPSV